MCSTSEDVQYESGTPSVHARMCSTNQAHLQYKRGCAVRIMHIFSTSEDVQYKSGTSSIHAGPRQVIKCKKRKCDTMVRCCQTRIHHQRQHEATIIADFAPASSHISHKQIWGLASRFLTAVRQAMSNRHWQRWQDLRIDFIL